MIGSGMRPRFERVVPQPPAQTLQHINDTLEQPDGACTGSILGRHVRLRIREDQRTFWTPQLDVEVEAHPDGALIRGLFGPHPDIWTFFIATYAVMTFCGITGLPFGLVQWSLGWSPWALWSVPISILMIGSVYVVALIAEFHHGTVDARDLPDRSGVVFTVTLPLDS